MEFCRLHTEGTLGIKGTPLKLDLEFCPAVGTSWPGKCSQEHWASFSPRNKVHVAVIIPKLYVLISRKYEALNNMISAATC